MRAATEASEITVYFSPGACSRVTMTALEEIGLGYSANLVDITKGDQKSAEYLAVNPKAKVPALTIGARTLTENAAILYHLHLTHSHAGLLPKEDFKLGVNEGLQDLVWCASTLHPITRQVRMPTRYTSISPQGVRHNGMERYAPILDTLSARFSTGDWWYGKNWSIVDVYLYWNYSTAASGGLDFLPYPAIVEHAERVLAWPSFVRALAREQDSKRREERF